MSLPIPVWHLEPASSDSVVLVFNEGRLLFPDTARGKPLWRYDRAVALGSFEADPLLVARWRDQDIYAVTLMPAQAAINLPSRSLREILTDEAEDFAMLCSSAVQLLHWQRDNRFCGRCGATTRILEKERTRYCDRCNHRLFPRLSPCVIVAIKDGDKVLLAQSHRAAGQFYSLIAGFVEPGESAEEAVHREVAEETGLQVGNVRYIESQSWAFPHQLMLGYLADYASGELVPEAAELADAGWFTRDSLPSVPGEWTIAGRLIRHALEGRM